MTNVTDYANECLEVAGRDLERGRCGSHTSGSHTSGSISRVESISRVGSISIVSGDGVSQTVAPQLVDERAAAVRNLFGDCTVVNSDVIDRLQEDVGRAVAAAVRYRRLYVEARGKMEEERKGARRKERERGEEVKTKVEDVVGRVEGTIVNMYKRGMVVGRSSMQEKLEAMIAAIAIREREIEGMEKEMEKRLERQREEFREAVATVQPKMAEVVTTNNENVESIGATLAAFGGVVNGFGIEIMSKCVAVELRETRLLEEVAEVRGQVSNLEAEVEEREREIERVEGVVEEGKGRILMLEETIREREERDERAERDFERSLTEGFIALKHCRRKEKKHYKVFRWRGGGGWGAIEWESGKKGKMFGFNERTVVEREAGSRLVVFRNMDGETLTMEIESEVEGGMFVDRFRGIMERRVVE